jgi:hypothetical protein
MLAGGGGSLTYCHRLVDNTVSVTTNLRDVTCPACSWGLAAQPQLPTTASKGGPPQPGTPWFNAVYGSRGGAWGGDAVFPTGKVVDEPKADTRYPHKCPRCGGAAYLTGNNLVEHPTGEYECT